MQSRKLKDSYVNYFLKVESSNTTEYFKSKECILHFDQNTF